MSENTGGPAYPTASGNYEKDCSGSGMTLRDRFAEKALQGLIAGSMADGSEFEVAAIPLIATSAYMFADAMLKAREL